MLYKSFIHSLILDISLASETFVAHIVLLWNFSYYTLCWNKFLYLISLPHCSSKKDKLHVLPILIISITLAQWQYVRHAPISAEYAPVDQRSVLNVYTSVSSEEIASGLLQNSITDKTVEQNRYTMFTYQIYYSNIQEVLPINRSVKNHNVYYKPEPWAEQIQKKAHHYKKSTF